MEINYSPVDKPKAPYSYKLIEPSLLFLLLSNLATIYFAVSEGWGIGAVLWIYWSQSVIIGFFNFVRMMRLKEFNTNGLKMNDKPVPATSAGKLSVSIFFAIHYGFFHLIYAIFLFTGKFGAVTTHAGSTEGAIKFILLSALLFFANHLFSYIYNAPKDTKRQNLGVLMFYPYVRIIPMHFFIIAGAIFGNSGLVIFLLGKTLADVVMHVIEHSSIKPGEEQSSDLPQNTTV